MPKNAQDRTFSFKFNFSVQYIYIHNVADFIQLSLLFLFLLLLLLNIPHCIRRRFVSNRGRVFDPGHVIMLQVSGSFALSIHFVV